MDMSVFRFGRAIRMGPRNTLLQALFILLVIIVITVVFILASILGLV
jgi:hypothetical protein